MISLEQRRRNDQRAGGTYPTARALLFSMYICIYLLLLIVKYYIAPSNAHAVRKYINLHPYERFLEIVDWHGMMLSKQTHMLRIKSSFYSK